MPSTYTESAQETVLRTPVTSGLLVTFCYTAARNFTTCSLQLQLRHLPKRMGRTRSTIDVKCILWRISGEKGHSGDDGVGDRILQEWII